MIDNEVTSGTNLAKLEAPQTHNQRSVYPPAGRNIQNNYVWGPDTSVWS